MLFYLKSKKNTSYADHVSMRNVALMHKTVANESSSQSRGYWGSLFCCCSNKASHSSDGASNIASHSSGGAQTVSAGHHEPPKQAQTPPGSSRIHTPPSQKETLAIYSSYGAPVQAILKKIKDAEESLNSDPEGSHNYVQVLFPNINPSEARPSNSDCALGAEWQKHALELINAGFLSGGENFSSLYENTQKMMDHWGFTLTLDPEISVTLSKSNKPNRIKEGDHNRLRVTRLLECLSIFEFVCGDTDDGNKLKKIKTKFYKCLTKDPRYANLYPETKNYWHFAQAAAHTAAHSPYTQPKTSPITNITTPRPNITTPRENTIDLFEGKPGQEFGNKRGYYTKKIIQDALSENVVFIFGANLDHMTNRAGGGGGQAAATHDCQNVVPVVTTYISNSADEIARIEKYHQEVQKILCSFVEKGGSVVFPMQSDGTGINIGTGLAKIGGNEEVIEKGKDFAKSLKERLDTISRSESLNDSPMDYFNQAMYILQRGEGSR